MIKSKLRLNPFLARQDFARILALENTLQQLQQTVRQYEDRLINPRQILVVDAELDIDDMRKRIKTLEDAIKRQKSNLGVDGRRKLSNLEGNLFLLTRLKALAVKTRLRDKLRQRKFELTKLERAYRQSVNERRLNEHANQSVKRREPGISVLVHKYNTLCHELELLKRRGHAPQNAILPHHINKEGIFDLDVDDNIWEDVGLHEDIPHPPDWLANNSVRDGIRHLLARDRCKEELHRLSIE
ncbi:hypothetical protein CONPUDRAFT_160579 [Coniophora puteana RWD-64-598 SS2]|uniref:Uncharacterized protein n=1 Tax=Coniophora puteana (strain RWD-64-598) TaxID=741705 RepID=R7SCN1_CONPW|nr:uncharacterized protein CONPUDRAFT_160579 [Coniophora puteana RWD-64-598 SS2]EIW73918.1 hypothetical protein CONPUDRAFT_160579 [Coniophora puteana RWD-64-598 SS2]